VNLSVGEMCFQRSGNAFAECIWGNIPGIPAPSTVLLKQY